MPARLLPALRSHPLRAGAFGLALILGLGAAVAVLGGTGSAPGPGHSAASTAAVDKTAPNATGTTATPAGELVSRAAGGATVPAASPDALAYDSGGSSVAAPV